MAYTITYQIDNKMYINLTNKCNNDCTFCIRNTSEGVSGYHLWLDKEPTVQEVIDNLEKGGNFDEVVFCGFGEPTYRYEAIVEIAKYCKEKGLKTRINTNGQSDLINGKDIVPMIAPYIDSINVSLNEVNKENYNKLCRPADKENAFNSMLDFTKRCSTQIKDVVMSIVDVIGEEKIEKAKEIANECGARLRVRKYEK